MPASIAIAIAGAAVALTPSRWGSNASFGEFSLFALLAVDLACRWIWRFYFEPKEGSEATIRWSFTDIAPSTFRAASARSMAPRGSFSASTPLGVLMLKVEVDHGPGDLGHAGKVRSRSDSEGADPPDLDGYDALWRLCLSSLARG
jgi:hypothetical protein